ncbi:MAG: energy transducer TonB [Tannerella sp.]|jgi:protein TonB|nr:energy transducer TonB [Tannerella sp.]
MEIKKSPKADLERGKGLSLLMGVVVGLAVLFVGFEWGTKEFKAEMSEGVTDILAEDDIEITKQEEEPPPPPPPPPAQVVAEVLNVVEDDAQVENADLMSTEDNANAAQAETYVPQVVEVKEEEEDENHIFTIVEEAAEFPGGQVALLTYLKTAIKYPVVAQENGIQGRVTCSFTINKDGSIVDVEVIRGVDPSLDREAIRVINAMPKWKPGKQRGKPVRVKYNLPVLFRLQN